MSTTAEKVKRDAKAIKALYRAIVKEMGSDDDAAEAFDRILRAVARVPLDRLDEQGVERIVEVAPCMPVQDIVTA